MHVTTSRACGRVLIARGRDATDVPFLRSFGEHELVGFEVTTELAAVDAETGEVAKEEPAASPLLA